MLVPAFNCGRVVETAGAGDGFTGGFAAALARGESPLDAVRFGCALASLSVTRPGTAPSMPTLAEIEAVLDGEPVKSGSAVGSPILNGGVASMNPSEMVRRPATEFPGRS